MRFHRNLQKVEPERNVPAISNTFTGPVSFGSGDAVSEEIVNTGNVSTEEKKTSFEKFILPIILVIIAGIFVLFEGVFGNQPTQIPTLENNKPEITVVSTTAIISTFTLTPSITPTLAPTPNICHYTNGPYTVGIINPCSDWKYGDIVQRLEKFGLDITLLDPSANYQEFSKYNVIYLPSGWGSIDPTLELYPSYLIKYVENGGGLLVEQPDSKNKFTPGFLPFTISFDRSKITPSDWPLVIVDNSYSITRGLGADELPGPMDCASFDSAYGALVKGGATGCTSLAITSYGSGRILVSLGNISPSMASNNLPMISDTAICRMFGWASKEY